VDRVTTEQDDPRLRELEAALERERATSRAATEQLAGLQQPTGQVPRAIPVPITNVSSWTVDAVMQHFQSLREADYNFYEERDRRYAEVAVEREKALKIKETADLAALELARQIQEYKDEKANELRSQIEREQGDRASKEDLKSLEEKLRAEHKTGSLDTRAFLFGLIGLMLILGQILAVLASGHVI
jgi:hypothetical protein